MTYIQICVGSACHLKGSAEIIEKMQSAITEHGVDDDVALAGSFCTGHCNRVGVTIIVNDVVHAGITPATFSEFFETVIMKAIKEEKGV